MFQIKICGVHSVEDARVVEECGADAVGLNFYPPSPRCVDEQVAQDICAAIPSRISKVGVFVNEPVAAIRRRVHELTLDYVQLHGDEPAETVVALRPILVIQAIRWDGATSSIEQYLVQCQQLGVHPAAILLDALHPQKYGGTGKTIKWTNVHHVRDRLGSVPLILAGGLDPSNVATAIATVKPAAVDVASGVEGEPGCKDQSKVLAFVRAARSAFS